MVAAVATDEPQIAPKLAHATIADMPTPPFRWPTNTSAALKSEREKPASAAKCPIRMKSGITDRS